MTSTTEINIICSPTLLPSQVHKGHETSSTQSTAKKKRSLWGSGGLIRGGSGGAQGPGPPLTTKNEAPAPKFYKIEAPEWQF